MLGSPNPVFEFRALCRTTIGQCYNDEQRCRVFPAAVNGTLGFVMTITFCLFIKFGCKDDPLAPASQRQDVQPVMNMHASQIGELQAHGWPSRRR